MMLLPHGQAQGFLSLGISSLSTNEMQMRMRGEFIVTGRGLSADADTYNEHCGGGGDLTITSSLSAFSSDVEAVTTSEEEGER